MVTKDELLCSLRAALTEERKQGIQPTPLTPERLYGNVRMSEAQLADPPLLTPAQVDYLVAETRRRWDEMMMEVRAVSEANRPYWRVILAYDEPRFVVACLQPFDEYDYDQSRFLTDAIYDEQEAQARANYANYLMPPYLRTVKHISIIRHAIGLR